MHRPLRLTCSVDALRSNYRWLSRMADVASGAAVKADGYGLGARDVVRVLLDEGCRDFFVSNWEEAAALGPLPGDASLAVLHGVGPDDGAAAASGVARPVLNTMEQIRRWKEWHPGHPCDVMVDTGMNRLGIRLDECEILNGLHIETLHSHLACADEDHPLNTLQLRRFNEAVSNIPARRYSLANSAGICLGSAYSFDLVRPGLALYGGIPRAEACGNVRPVAAIEAQVLQRRMVRAGETVGYGATFVAEEDIDVAVLNIGYADGYWRTFARNGRGCVDGHSLPVVGRVSMDLLAMDCSAAPAVCEGDWVEIEFDLRVAAETTGMTQYELLTGLGDRFERVWR